MSTEHQQYSIANQRDAIRKYANDYDMEIVKTYSDAGKSGLTFERRDALQALIADVESGCAEYSVVLVYDVSRWGRFQDVDESAYYEYRCKRAHIAVHYCAEQFLNDGSVSSALLKAIKRTMAGEYSRELSAKVFAGKCRLVEAGFRGGGPAGYGLRRLLVDQHGTPKAVLKRGELKSLVTDRVLQIPGPPEEIAVVRDIFRWYAEDRLVPRLIADRLNARGILSEYGRPWTRSMVQSLVTNPKYIGANVTNRRSYKLGGKVKANPRDRWIIREGTWVPVIDAETFGLAQSVASSRSVRYSDEYLLDALKELLARMGKLTVPLIDRDPNMPNSRVYHLRFGSMFEAYRRIGYPRNPRKNEAAVDQMAASIKEFGFAIPVLARSSGEVIDGHLRLKAARKMGSWPGGETTGIPVIPCDGWTDAQVKAFRLMVNRSVTWAEWDPDLLGLELLDLKNLEFDLGLTGFDEEELVRLLAAQDATDGLCDEDAAPPVPQTPTSKAGDLWLLGRHRLLCGDSTDPENVSRVSSDVNPDLQGLCLALSDWHAE